MQAGSGKSTLMKFLCEHKKTQQALQKWADPVEPYSASFFFWNQGFEMQKSQTGLLQALLYQVLRRMPRLIPDVVPDDRLEHETWDINELKAAFRRLLGLSASHVRAKFCIFIDGLDEYNGDEEELVEILRIFDQTTYLKLCVSSRPRHYLDEYYKHRRKILHIHEFTKDDMETHIRQELQDNENFRKIQRDSPRGCKRLLRMITDQAQGVWLWVYLVTHDLVHCVNRNEDIDKLLDIVSKFPPDLESYFKHIIERIKPAFREEMAQIFLIAVDEVQPLPLFAFSLLQREKGNIDYAVSSPISPLSKQDLENSDETWKARIQNRGSDLLVVSDGEHPTFLHHPVDFLHRTVRDFLRDCYYESLLKQVSPAFNPLVSLCRMMVFLLKSLPPVDLRKEESITQLIKLVDELLYYAHEVEKRYPESQHSATVYNLLDEADRTCSTHGRSIGTHWTNVRDSATTRGYDEYREGRECNFLALAIQARLSGYVALKLSDPRAMQKRGRPLLDYALRPRRVTPLLLQYHSRRDDSIVDADMVRLLLDHGADPNQKVHLNEGRTVWQLFLLSCYEAARRGQSSPSLIAVWSRVSEQLITEGAELDVWISNTATDKKSHLIVSDLLDEIFGKGEANRLWSLPGRSKVKYLGWLGWWPWRQ